MRFSSKSIDYLRKLTSGFTSVNWRTFQDSGLFPGLFIAGHFPVSCSRTFHGLYKPWLYQLSNEIISSSSTLPSSAAVITINWSSVRINIIPQPHQHTAGLSLTNNNKHNCHSVITKLKTQLDKCLARHKTNQFNDMPFQAIDCNGSDYDQKWEN